MITRITRAPLVALAGLMFVFAQTYAADTNVNCDKGGSIQKAIEAGAGSAAAKTINVRGFCEEDLLITRDNVSLLGDGNAMISGRIVMRGAVGVTIRDLTVTGPRDGVSASLSRVFMTNVHFTGNTGSGIAVRAGSVVYLRDGSIAHNTGGIGLLVDGGFASLDNTDVFSNEGDGIVVNANGSLSFNGGRVHSHESGTGILARLGASIALSDADVSGNMFAGVNVSLGSTAAIYSSGINDNVDIGLIVTDNSSVEVGGCEFANNGLYGALAGRHSVLKLIDSHVHDNHAHGVVVETDAGLFIDGTTVVDGNWADDEIECRGKEASMEIGPDAYVSTWSCIDPDF
jgi:hypothetical protein